MLMVPSFGKSVSQNKKEQEKQRSICWTDMSFLLKQQTNKNKEVMLRVETFKKGACSEEGVLIVICSASWSLETFL